MKLTHKIQVDIINDYTINLVPMIKLAEKYKVTRQAVHKVLKKNGVDTSKHKIEVSCTCCGATMLRTKCRIRERKFLFCSMACYSAFIDAGQPGRYVESRYGQKIARSVISKYFDIQPNHIIHHEDRNENNNNINNLKVFANRGDHIRYHRWANCGIDIVPIFDGSTIPIYSQ